MEGDVSLAYKALIPLLLRQHRRSARAKHLIFGSSACRLIVIDEVVMTKVHEQTLLEKLRNLPPERLAEVEDFVDFLANRQTDERGLTQAAGQLATAAFTRVWDNPADADYDRL